MKSAFNTTTMNKQSTAVPVANTGRSSNGHRPPYIHKSGVATSTSATSSQSSATLRKRKFVEADRHQPKKNKVDRIFDKLRQKDLSAVKSMTDVGIPRRKGAMYYHIECVLQHEI